MKLFVGNVDYQATQATEEELEQIFRTWGYPPSDVRILYDRTTGKARGFGFVEFPDEATALQAMAQVNGVMLYGRRLTVREATQQNDRRTEYRRLAGDSRAY